jgi:hypothetical protein
MNQQSVQASEDMSIHAWFNNFQFLATLTATPVVVKKSLLNSLDEIRWMNQHPH